MDSVHFYSIQFMYLFVQWNIMIMRLHHISYRLLCAFYSLVEYMNQVCERIQYKTYVTLVYHSKDVYVSTLLMHTCNCLQSKSYEVTAYVLLLLLVAFTFQALTGFGTCFLFVTISCAISWLLRI